MHINLPLHLLQRISAACARTRRASASKAPASTVSFPSSCVKEATSPTTTAPAASPFTAESLTMKTLCSSTPLQVSACVRDGRLFFLGVSCPRADPHHWRGELSSTQVSSPWPTLGPTPTARSSSSPRTRRTGWTANTWCLESWWRGWMYFVQWR